MSLDRHNGYRAGLAAAATWHRKQARSMHLIVEDCERGLITNPEVRERAKIYAQNHDACAVSIEHLPNE